MQIPSLTGLFTPRGWGLLSAGAAFLLAAGVLGRRDLLAVAVLLMGLPLAAAVLLRLAKPGFDVERTFTPPLTETGTAATVQLSIRCRGSQIPSATMREGLPLRFGRSPEFHFPSGLAVDGRASTYEYRLRSSRRGLYAIGPVTAEFLDPFGLAKTVHTLGGTDQLAVAPAPQDLPVLALSGARGTEGTSPSRRRGTPSEDDATTREYRYGDPMRRVHWPATARHGELMVRQEEPVTAPTASILLDQRAAAYGAGALPGSDDSRELLTTESFEWAVSAVISGAVHFSDGGYSVRFVDESSSPGLLHSPSAVDADESGFGGSDGVHNLAEGLAGLGLQPAAPAPAQTADPLPAEPFGDTLLDGLAGGRTPGPLLMIGGRLTTSEATALAGAARYSPQPLALLVTDRPADLRPVLRILREAGWVAAAVAPATPIASAWALLDRDRDGTGAATPAAHAGAGPRRKPGPVVESTFS
ncbi:DUF58 domain-containing protein [Arthrobacter zhangbolii]|uniref:DUF58 domain-containing protein n=1 Tax=Arthrobacter zhangbolii TaxID=2886936 RepID=UPI0022B0B175|nr:DUF58 domain-containing protein [Arthrobacter zhangbolii]